MTAATDLLADAFGRVREVVHDVVAGLGPEELSTRPEGRANSIAWLCWHLTRIQDDHIAAAAGTEQVWTSEGWCERFGLPFPPDDTGYGHSGEDVAAVRGLTPDLLTGYHEAVYDRTVRFVTGRGDADFERIVDESWTPPVTLGVRLVSVISDDLQHAGQAAFVRGLISR